MSKDRSEEIRRFDGPLRGQALFAIVFLVASALLLSQLGNETKWAKGTQFFAQPRFWPAVSVIGMVLFGGLHLWKLPRRGFERVDVVEWKIWFFAIEYVIWFLAYVMLVPKLGYLPMTISCLRYATALAIDRARCWVRLCWSRLLLSSCSNLSLASKFRVGRSMNTCQMLCALSSF